MMDLSRLADGLDETEPGFWEASEHDAVSYRPGGHHRCLAVEDTSFWFRHRSECIVAVVRRFPPAGAIFDIGGGNGHVARELLAAGFPAVVVEPGADGARAAFDRGIRPVIRGTVESARFRAGSIPAAGMFDVLEHIDDDVAFLGRLKDLMVRGGRLYLTVPAYPWLWSFEDDNAGHFRRHTDRTVRAVLAAAGFDVEYVSNFFRPLPLPLLVVRTLPTRLRLRSRSLQSAGAEHRRPPGVLGAIFDRVLTRELSLVQTSRMRFGSSIVVVARVR